MNITPNLQIRPEDIRNNPELWIQKISVIIFTDENGKPWWTKEYKFIPNHKRYNQAVKWIKDTNFAEYNCRIVQNANNEIEIITRNYFGKKASLEQEQKEVLGKIRKKLGEEIRRISQSLELGVDWEKWKNISLDFTEGLVREWIQQKFNYSQAKEWINIGLNVRQAKLAEWLKNSKNLTPEQVLNTGDLEELNEEYWTSHEELELEVEEEYEEPKEVIKELRELGKSNNVQDFIESEYRELFEEEAEELEKLEREKEGLGENEQGVSYDLGRPDLAILWRKQLYFVSSFEYTNNWKLTVEIRARKCLLGIYYWNWMRGGGAGYLLEAPIQKENDKMHYEFCGDLSIKANYQQAFGYQPRFYLFKVWAKALTFAKAKTEEEGQESAQIPVNLSYDFFDEVQTKEILEKAKEEDDDLEKYTHKFEAQKEDERSRKESIIPLGMGGFLRNMFSKKIFLTVGCEEQMKAISAGEPNDALYSHATSGEEVLFTKNDQMAEWLKNQPHLRRHATFQ